MNSIFRSATLVTLLALLSSGCEGTLGPGDAPESHELYYLYGLDEGPNAAKRTPSSLDPSWISEASPYRRSVAPIGSVTRFEGAAWFQAP